MGKNPSASARHKRCGFNTWVGKIFWRRKWQPAPVFLPGKFHGQRSLVGYSSRGRKELDTTKQLNSEEIHWSYFGPYWCLLFCGCLSVNPGFPFLITGASALNIFKSAQSPFLEEYCYWFFCKQVYDTLVGKQNFVSM